MLLIWLFQHTSYLVQIFTKPAIWFGSLLNQLFWLFQHTSYLILIFYSTSIFVRFHSAPQFLFCWSSILFISSDRSSYSGDGLLYVYRTTFRIFTQSIDAIDVTSVTLSRLNSINARNWFHKMLIECSNVPMFQCLDVQMFKCSNSQLFK